MVVLHWRGWTEVQDAYESLLRDKVLPSLRNIEGYRGGYILRTDGPQEVEFVVVNLFDSLESVKRFAGPDYRIPVFEPEAKRTLAEDRAGRNALRSPRQHCLLTALCSKP
jgi:hypothetical protein